MVPYRVSNPSRRTSGRSARAPSRATSSHPLAGGPQSEVRRGADFLTCPVRPCLSINERLYYPSEWTRLKSRNTPERGRGMSGHAAGTLWVSNPRIESPCVAERRRSVGGPHVGRFSLAWWWLRAPYGDPILRPRMIPYRVSNPSRRTSGRSARAPSRATNHTLSPAVRNPKLEEGLTF